VTRIEERRAAVEDYTAEPKAPGPAPQRRPGEGLRDKLFYFGVAAASAAISVGVACIDPIQVYDCAREPNGSVECTVHQRVFGLIPISDLHFPRIQSVEVVSGVNAETMSETRRRLEFGTDRSSWDALVLVGADGTRSRPSKTSWPLGRTIHDLRAGIQGLIDARAPEDYRAWTGDKVTLAVSAAFLVPAGMILLGLLLRLVVPRSFVEQRLLATRDRLRRARASGGSPRR
jgi:hypothetical protein